MSLRVMAYAMELNAPSPIAKLVLLYGADRANENGVMHLLEGEKIARFCCCTVEDVDESICELVDARILLVAPDGGWLMNGYLPPTRSPIVPGKRQLPPKKRMAVFQRDGHRCVTCGTVDNLSVDHIHPESKGGSHDMANLQTLCRPCNIRKGVKLP